MDCHHGRPQSEVFEGACASMGSLADVTRGAFLCRMLYFGDDTWPADGRTRTEVELPTPVGDCPEFHTYGCRFNSPLSGPSMAKGGAHGPNPPSCHRPNFGVRQSITVLETPNPTPSPGPNHPNSPTQSQNRPPHLRSAGGGGGRTAYSRPIG